MNYIHLLVMKLNNMDVIHMIKWFIYSINLLNSDYWFLACPLFGKTVVVFQSNICVFCLFIQLMCYNIYMGS